MKIKFWGVRGSIPVSDKKVIKYGGNTTCVEILTDDNHTIIIDAGTGLRSLGNNLLTGDFGKGKGKASFLFTHTHWDHIQGFPFFVPFFIGKKESDNNKIKGMCNEFHFYGEKKGWRTLERILSDQMKSPYFPVTLKDMNAIFNFSNITENDEFYIGDTKITCKFLRHPDSALGYRIECNGKIYAHVCDTEHPEAGIDSNVLELAKGSDIFVYDSQFTPEEYPKFKNWGHSTWQEGIKISQKIGADKLYLFHHAPSHDDDFMDIVIEEASSHFKETHAAMDGLEINI
ncbi:MAG: MBL fold metallo-hydrolase [Candidatus Firestonebacteria bacterium]|nr:MBL fold metallo-hydrolase [Candidatus Firestonebacteria bacterium]